MSVLTELKKRIASGELIEDDAQLGAAAMLDDLLTRLAKPSGKPWFFSRRSAPPKGLYLWGGVGRGKSMLMDWFYEAAPTQNKITPDNWPRHGCRFCHGVARAAETSMAQVVRQG